MTDEEIRKASKERADKIYSAEDLEDENNDTNYCHCINDFIAGAKWAEQRRWIPVAERLPADTNEVEVLVEYVTLDDYSKVSKLITSGFYEANINSWETNLPYGDFDLLSQEVTHWHPLPPTDAVKE